MNQTTDPMDISAVAEELFTVNLTPEQIDSFWSKISSGKPDDCWDWKLGIDKKGYGKMGLKYPGTRVNRTLITHRVAFFLVQGSFPSKLSVLHTCDRPRCCNPRHLFLGTQLDNMRDMCQKGRKAIDHPNRAMGEKINTTKLTPDAVRKIRRNYGQGETQESLAATHGVTQANVSAIVRRQTWKSII